MSDVAAPPPNTPGNIPEFTVSEISGAVKRTLEGAFGRVRVRGEITEMKRYPSGHIYFSLKDEGGKISGIVWKGAVSRLGLVPENGVEVIATGKVSAYGERSSYQLIVDGMEYAGAGALLKRIEMLKQRLTEEGLFDPARKRALPLLPRIVGVVSSPQGAVIQDIRTTIERRFPRRVILWPVPVQGADAAPRIAAAIAGFCHLPSQDRPDVVIVARGGGSLEDLMAFNDEAVVRAAAGCAIPLISAVGHETDTTLIDFASDRRAPTPTAAAELAVPSRAELVADLQHKAARLAGALHRQAQQGALRLHRAASGLPDLPGLLGHARQRLDDRQGRLQRALPALVASRRAALTRAERDLPHPRHLVDRTRQSLAHLFGRLHLALPHRITAAHTRRVQLGVALDAALRGAVAARQNQAARVLGRLRPAPLLAQGREARARLEGLGARLEAISPLAVLARGYALVSDAAGHPVTSAAGVHAGERLHLRFADGEAEVTARGEAKGARQGRLPI